jgi:hypothetical protein
MRLTSKSLIRSTYAAWCLCTPGHPPRHPQFTPPQTSRIHPLIHARCPPRWRDRLCSLLLLEEDELGRGLARVLDRVEPEEGDGSRRGDPLVGLDGYGHGLGRVAAWRDRDLWAGKTGRRQIRTDRHT